MIILSIETSCDETAMAIVEATGGIRVPRFRILKNIVSSQIKIHAPYGGVVPNLAKREHLKNLPIVYRQVLGKSKVQNPPPKADPSPAEKFKSNPKSKFPINRLTDPPIDLIAVTVGPGLEPALWTGVEFAKKIAGELKKPLVGTNHLEGHLYSFLFQQKTASSKLKAQNSKKLINRFTDSPMNQIFPAIALIASGGHTILVCMNSLTSYKKIGETRDDAAGEAFDKVARMLGLPYPGGPEVEKLALRQAQGKPEGTIPFPRPMLHTKNFDFSFSGLKTAVLYYLRDKKKATSDKESSQQPATDDKNESMSRVALPMSLKRDVAASFQAAVIDVLTQKTMRAAREFGARSVMLSGGVAANRALRQALKRQATRNKMHFFVPPPSLNTDNAVMIAGAAYINFLRKLSDAQKRGSKSRTPSATGLRGKRYRITAQANLNL